VAKDDKGPEYCSTGAFPGWINMARELAEQLGKHPDLASIVLQLRHFADVFERWNDPILRPPPAERSPIICEFMSVRGDALRELSARGWQPTEKKR
jgi:hypothetical protein